MAFRIDPGKPIAQEIRRAATEQVERALSEIDDPALGSGKTVHQVRKRCKKLRGLLRLLRYVRGVDYKGENARYRDAAADLSHLRDSHVLCHSFDSVTATLSAPADTAAIAALRERLLSEGSSAEPGHARERLRHFRAQMVEGRERIESWALDNVEFKTLEPGLRANYRRARKAMRRALQDLRPAPLHEWRKYVKYHAHHLHLLTPAWHRPLRALEQEAAALGEILGEDHDLTVLREALQGLDTAADTEQMAKVQKLITTRQAELRGSAHHIGARLFAEKPRAFGKRMSLYWRAA